MLFLWILDKTHIIFYKHNRRLCWQVLVHFSLFFWNSGLLGVSQLFCITCTGNNATWLYVPLLQFCKTHCSVAKYIYALLMCTILLLFIVIFNLGWSGWVSLIWGPDYMRLVQLQIGLHTNACFCLHETGLKNHLVPVSLIPFAEPTWMTRTGHAPSAFWGS